MIRYKTLFSTVKKRLLFLFLFFSLAELFGQRDTEHWVAPYFDSMGSSYIHGLYFSTDSATPFTVKIYSNNNQIGSVTISKGSPATFTVDPSYIKLTATSEAASKSNKGIYTIGDKPYFLTMRIAAGAHAEIITSKGRAGIGTEFFAAAAPVTVSANNYNFTTGILATEDNTTVNISGYNPSISFLNVASTPSVLTVTLNKGQSYTLAGITNTIPNRDGFIGAKITSDKPITVTNGNSNGFYATTANDGSDLIMDQSIPVGRLGNEFAMIKSVSTSPYNMDGGIVIATENNTQIFLNNSINPIVTINAGQYYRILANAYVNQGNGHSNMYVKTSKNVYLYQLVGVGDGGYTGGYNLIPPLNCFLPRKIDEIGKINEMPNISSLSVRLNILTQVGANITVNGNAPTAVQGPYPLQGNNDWVTYSIQNITGNTTITSDKAVTAGINGGYTNAGYGGYFAGFSSIPVIMNKSGECAPDITLEVDDSYDTYQWYLNGNSIPGATSNTYMPAQGGNYTVKITAGSCEPKFTPVYKVNSCLKETTKNDSICGDHLQIVPQFSQSSQTLVPGSVVVITPPSHGTATIDPSTGNINYIADPGYNGADTLVYKFCGNDPEFPDCEQVTLHLNISKAPAAQNASLSICSVTDTAVFNLKDAETTISSEPGVGFSYYQNLADADAGNANTLSNPTAYSSANTTIYVRVSSGFCYSIAELQLIVNAKPVPVITASSTVICHDIPVVLTSSLPMGNVWSTGETTQSITVNSGGVYTLVNDNGSCKSDSVAVTILKGEDPHLLITGNLVFCEGDSTLLTAVADGTGNSFLWSNGTTGNTLTVTAAGTYTVTVTTALGCQYQKTVTVKMDPLIVVSIVPPTKTITCIEHTITLDGTGSVYQPGATFLWAASSGGNIVSGGNTLTPVVDKGGVYTLSISSSTPMGCIKQNSVTVQQDTTPPPVVLSATQIIICKGESVILTASGAVTYTWAGLPGNGNTQTVSPAVTTTYTVEGTGLNGCSAEASIIITVVPAIESILHDIKVCKGQKGLLDAGSGPNYTYLWNTGETTRTIEVTQDGIYTVTINNGVCSKQYSANVSYTQVPDILEVIYENDNLKIRAKNNETLPLEYSIDGGVLWQNSEIFYNVNKNTEYAIRVRNVGTLCDTSVQYYTFFLPNTFTPNGDGINDVISFAGISKLRNFSAIIVDRYGHQVFKATESNPVWDGKYLSSSVPTASYWYTISWEDPVSRKPFIRSGWILVKNRN
ncbi:gliding motility-associated-like protein [Chryseobacterium bernardetii]|uniref:Gliding motility-associated-like protein n=1 Tax=Chryseobacterium bernardetii TaxID=1241978 RepID=A0ACC6IUE3_9FLAO|nr:MULTISPECIES: T9SS type B sorting domain-containing protein [Chryseobacterium]MDR6370895.1 gliding motility-associated-like protein [Chryseobacterium vietnamense]MDR6441359.1 gliding motility-associated-like protein [Chryseobacterium bernardetii]